MVWLCMIEKQTQSGIVVLVVQERHISEGSSKPIILAWAIGAARK